MKLFKFFKKNKPKVKDNQVNFNRLSTKSVFLFVVLVLTIVMTSTIVVQLLKMDINNLERSVSQPKATWRIFSLTVNADIPELATIQLISNFGGFKTIDEVYAYGMSDDKSKIAVYSTRGLQLYDLNNDKLIQYSIEGKTLTGIQRDGIVFGYGDQYFAFAALTADSPYFTQLLIFDTKGEMINRIDLSVYYEEYASSPTFSKVKNLFIVRTYVWDDLDFPKNDGSKYAVGELPIYLSLFNIAGEELEVFKVRDYGNISDSVYYTWDSFDLNTINYVIYNKNTPPNFFNKNIYNKLSIVKSNLNG
jgi:hypothetical protein